LVSESGSSFGDLVELQVPASSAYLTVLRTTAARLAARLGFTLDEIEDLRIAVDEAGAMLLPLAVPGSNMHCSFQLHTDILDVVVSVPAAQTDLPSRDSFAWTVLSALAGEVHSRVEDGRVSIMLRKKRG
jgi:serine/threonine-protein kinase RsbW